MARAAAGDGGWGAAAVAAAALLVAVVVQTWRRKRAPALRLPPEIPPSALANAPWHDIRALLHLVQSHLRSRNNVARLQPPLGKPFVLLADRDALRSVLVKQANHFTKEHAFNVIERFRRTRISGNRPAWQPVHRLASSFARKGAEDASPELERVLERFVNRHVLRSPGSDVELARGFRDMYWGVTLHLVLGVAPDHPALAGERGIYATAWHSVIRQIESPLVNAIQAWQYLPTPGNLHYRFVVARLRRCVREIVRADATPAPAFSLARALQMDASLTDNDRLELAMEFLFTGTVSVTSVTLMLLWHLAQDAEHQRRARASVADALGGSLRAPTLAEASRVAFPHLELCLKEALRMYSPICIGRKALRTTELPDGSSIPAGADVAANAWFVHRDPSAWRSPDAFDPDRFAASADPPPPGAYMPFSLGPRGCPGSPATFAIAKFLAAGVLSRAHLHPASAPSAAPAFLPSLVLPNTPNTVAVRATPLRAPAPAAASGLCEPGAW